MELGAKNVTGTLEELQDKFLVLSVCGSNDHEQEEDDSCDEIEVEEEQKEYEWKDYSAKGLQTLLSQQPDFANEKCMLEEELEAKGDLCIFLPKFHCELNMIELIWGRSKYYVRRTQHQDKGTLRALVGGQGGDPPGLIWKSFLATDGENPGNLPLSLVWKYAAKCRDFIRLYNKEVSVGIIHNVRKQYKSHRRVFNFDKHTEVTAFKGTSWAEIEVQFSVNPS